jgi:hypothetical protein
MGSVAPTVVKMRIRPQALLPTAVVAVVVVMVAVAAAAGSCGSP